MNNQGAEQERADGEQQTGHRIEVCARNLPLGSQAALRRLLNEFPDVTLKRWACLGPCEYCARRPFLLVNGREYVSAQDGDELYEQVCARLNAIHP